jgi:transposase
MCLKRHHDVGISPSGGSRILKRLELSQLPGSQRHKAHQQRWMRFEKPLPGHQDQVDGVVIDDARLFNEKLREWEDFCCRVSRFPGQVMVWCLTPRRSAMGHQPTRSVEDKNRIVLAVLRGEISIEEVARREGVSQVSISKWRDQFLAGGQRALADGARHGPSGREQALAAEVEQLTSALGEAHLELRLWRKGGALYAGSTSAKRNR